MMHFPPLYPITDATQELSLSGQIVRFAQAGFPLVQFRGKSAPISEQWSELRLALTESFHNGGWPLIVVNDRADLAILAACEGMAPWGLHLGQSDLSAAEAARLPGLGKLHFGASTHNPSEWVSVDCVYDHAGVGPIRATQTKKDHVGTIGFEGLAKGCATLRQKNIAAIAIGGLTIDDSLASFEAGAESMAISHSLSPAAMESGGGNLADCLWQAQKTKYSLKPVPKRGQGTVGTVLVGGSGAGKTALAQCLALRLGLPALDLDHRISQKAGKSIAEIFSEGENTFRAIESECLPACLEKPSILSLGGGAWQQEAIRHCIKKSGWNVIWLAENPIVAWERTRMDTNRPLAKDRAIFMEKWRSRMPLWSLLPSLLPLGRSAAELAELLAP
jgi:thiamine-phosphate pyrophosphorylase